MARVSLLVLGLIALSLTIAAPARPVDQFMFRTPDHAAYCGMNFVRKEWKEFVCFTPNDGFYVRMTNLYGARVKISKGYLDRFVGYRNRRVPLWRFGRTWYSSDAEIVTCSSRRTGLTCRHWRGRGWWLGRFRGYRIF
jgi:hypothetical protein